MSNPAVVRLTSTQVCGREVKIEDNLGEAIHIHLGEIRVDLTVEEFEKLSQQCENILDQMDTLINTSLFSWRNLNPIFLQNPKNMDMLFRLKNAYITKVKVKDILVDSYVTLPFVGSVPAYRGIRHSRVVKALEGKNEDNEKYSQLNNLFTSNAKRLKENMDSIKTNGYPYNEEYIILNQDNMIIDGQHRAACLYYLFGSEYEIPVMKWEFEDSSHTYFPSRKTAIEIVLRSYLLWSRSWFSKIIRLPFQLYRKLKNKKTVKKQKLLNNKTTKQQKLVNGKTPNDILCLQEIIDILVDQEIDFLVLDNNYATFEQKKVGLTLLVDKESHTRFETCMSWYGFAKEQMFSEKYNYLYSLEKDTIYSNGYISIHAFNQLFCKSMFENAMVPLDKTINKAAWTTKKYNESLKCFQVGNTVSTILMIVQSIFFDGRFSEKRKEDIQSYFFHLENDQGKELLYNVFFRFTDTLLKLIQTGQFDDIIKEYVSFIDY